MNVVYIKIAIWSASKRQHVRDPLANFTQNHFSRRLSVHDSKMRNAMDAFVGQRRIEPAVHRGYPPSGESDIDF